MGNTFRLPDHGQTLMEIGETEAESFYSGDLADKIDAFSRESGGYIRKKDLERFKPQWVEPISVNYRGYDIWGDTTLWPRNCSLDGLKHP